MSFFGLTFLGTSNHYRFCRGGRDESVSANVEREIEKRFAKKRSHELQLQNSCRSSVPSDDYMMDRAARYDFMFRQDQQNSVLGATGGRFTSSSSSSSSVISRSSERGTVDRADILWRENYGTKAHEGRQFESVETWKSRATKHQRCRYDPDQRNETPITSNHAYGWRHKEAIGEMHRLNRERSSLVQYHPKKSCEVAYMCGSVCVYEYIC